MTAAQQNRQPRGIPTGGRFAPDAHAEPEVALERRGYPEGHLLHGCYSYRGAEAMPAWPASLPEPKASIDLEHGTQLYLEIEGHEMPHFWGDEYDSYSTLETEPEHWPELDEETREAVAEYGAELRRRADTHVHGLAARAISDTAVQKAILDDCLGREPETEPEMTYREHAHNRAERAMEAAGTSGDPESDLADMLANLRHFADKHGLDFADADRRAYGYYTEESSDPDFDTAF